MTETWKKRASHAIDELNLRPPTIELGYKHRFREPIENSAYRLYQALASAGIPYSVKVPKNARTTYLSVRVSESNGVAARAVIRQLTLRDAAI
jgi:hypothetical protein